MVSELTRRDILDSLLLKGRIEGRLELIEFLNRIWDLSTMPSEDPRFDNAAEDIWKHMVANDDWTESHLYSTRLELATCPEEVLFNFLEVVVHPMVRVSAEQAEWVETINEHLRRDGFELKAVARLSGYPVFSVVPVGTAPRAAKQLIFAANGPKPEIVLADAVDNDIKIVKNAEYCLVYDRPIGPKGLSWVDLTEWWADREHMPPEEVETQRSLYRRLLASLAGSPPEQKFFRRYFEKFHAEKELNLPALIPQVYLHYDPYTLRERGGAPVLNRQRMDFLLLLPRAVRIVIEIDSKQHYAE